MLYLEVAAVDRSLRRTASVLTESWCGVSSVVKLLRGRGRRRDAGSAERELRLGSLAQPPVLLVHGLGADKSCFSNMEGRLHRAGYTVYSLSYSCLGSDIETCARNLERETAWLLEETGSSHVHVVAHSLGGVVLRWAAAHTRVRDWMAVGITLGSPHRGTPTARLAPVGLPGFGKIVSQLRPGALTTDEVDVEPGAGARWVAIAGESDLVVPPKYARMAESGNVRNVVVPWCGHMTLTRNSQCLDIILEELRAAGEARTQTRPTEDVSTGPRDPSLLERREEISAMPTREHILDCFCGQPLDEVATSITMHCTRCGRIVPRSPRSEAARSRDGAPAPFPAAGRAA